MSRQTYTHTSGNGSSAIRYREAGTAKPRVSSDPGLVVPMSGPPLRLSGPPLRLPNHSRDERIPLARGESQHGPDPVVLGIPDGDVAIDEKGNLHTVSVGTTMSALTPYCTGRINLHDSCSFAA